MISSKPSNITVSQSACKKTGLLFSKSKHSKGSHDQNMTVSTIFAELLILLLQNLVLTVHYHKPECPMEKWDCCVQGQGHSKSQNVDECLSR